MAFAKTKARCVDSNGKTLVHLSFPEGWDQYQITPELIAKVLAGTQVEINGGSEDLLKEFGATKAPDSGEEDEAPF